MMLFRLCFFSQVPHSTNAIEIKTPEMYSVDTDELVIKLREKLREMETLKKRERGFMLVGLKTFKNHNNQESVVLTKAWTQIDEAGRRAHTSAAHQSLTKGQRQFDIEKKIFSRNSAATIGSPYFKNVSLDTGRKPFASSNSAEAVEPKEK